MITSQAGREGMFNTWSGTDRVATALREPIQWASTRVRSVPDKALCPVSERFGASQIHRHLSVDVGGQWWPASASRPTICQLGLLRCLTSPADFFRVSQGRPALRCLPEADWCPWAYTGDR